ncbi:MAG: hypothetical protein ABJL54_11665 [Halioglobus sp.]
MNNKQTALGTATSRSLWLLSICVSLILAGTLSYQWDKARAMDPSSDQLTTSESVERELQHYMEALGIEREELKLIPTGAYIQSLSFNDASEVYMTGFLWQIFSRELPEDIYAKWVTSCEHKEPPWTFPDSVYNSSSSTSRLAYGNALYDGNDENAEPIGRLCGWYFEATLRQKFNYSRYPFDTTAISLRLWFRDMHKHVVMAPHFDSYPNGTGLNDLFGINDQIVLSAWSRKNTYFNYTHSSANTNFGMLEMDLLNSNPELNYTFVIKRLLADSMVEHLLGILVVMVLLYATLLVVSRDKEKAERHGFNTAMVLGACSALFFVVLISHIQIRGQFGGSSLVYLECFYYLAYLLLIGTTVNTYLFAEDPRPFTAIIHYGDNIVPKVLFWPLVLLVSVIFTQVMLF